MFECKVLHTAPRRNSPVSHIVPVILFYCKDLQSDIDEHETENFVWEISAVIRLDFDDWLESLEVFGWRYEEFCIVRSRSILVNIEAHKMWRYTRSQKIRMKIRVMCRFSQIGVFSADLGLSITQWLIYEIPCANLRLCDPDPQISLKVSGSDASQK